MRTPLSLVFGRVDRNVHRKKIRRNNIDNFREGMGRMADSGWSISFRNPISYFGIGAKRAPLDVRASMGR